jgi:hypothetical protein
MKDRCVSMKLWRVDFPTGGGYDEYYGFFSRRIGAYPVETDKNLPENDHIGYCPTSCLSLSRPNTKT